MQDRNAAPPPTTCRVCPNPIATTAAYNVKLYCSPSCANWAFTRPGEMRPTTSTCAHCGREFPFGRGRKFCSGDCRLAKTKALRQAPPLDGVCSCGQPVPPRPPGKPGPAPRWCSLECKTRDRRVAQPSPGPPRKRAKAELLPERLCAHDGKPFVPRQADAAYCSAWCRRAAHRIAYRHRTRELKASGEQVRRAIVHARDGGRCHICRKLIDLKLRRPNPMAMAMDHVVPLSKGGEHSYANIKAAHWICNSLKSDGYVERGEQLMLIG